MDIFIYLNMFIQDNAFENVVCEMAAILSRPQCVNIHQERPTVVIFSELSNGTKHRKENQLQSLELSCRIS